MFLIPLAFEVIGSYAISYGWQYIMIGVANYMILN